MKKYNHFVNGKEMLPNGGEYFETENPYTCEKWAEVAKGDAFDVDAAVNVAKEVFENNWSKTKPTERGKLLVRLAELVERDAQKLGEIEVQDNGKLIPFCKIFSLSSHFCNKFSVILNFNFT